MKTNSYPMNESANNKVACGFPCWRACAYDASSWLQVIDKRSHGKWCIYTFPKWRQTKPKFNQRILCIFCLASFCVFLSWLNILSLKTAKKLTKTPSKQFGNGVCHVSRTLEMHGHGPFPWSWPGNYSFNREKKTINNLIRISDMLMCEREQIFY